MDAVEYKEDAFKAAKEKGEKLVKICWVQTRKCTNHSSFWMER